MNEVYILIGGNTGKREFYISEAKKFIQTELGNVVSESTIYETKSWGFEAEQLFLNQVIVVKTNQNPIDTLNILLQIEIKLGRNRVSANYESRSIDLDILFYNDSIIDSNILQVPHPKLHKRMFTLIPLNEIAPGKLHPKLNKTVNVLLSECNDSLEVLLFKPTR